MAKDDISDAVKKALIKSNTRMANYSQRIAKHIWCEDCAERDEGLNCTPDLCKTKAFLIVMEDMKIKE